MSERLKKYRSMRDFARTPEPSGGAAKKRRLPIFVIQKHHASRLHYDFRLEMEGVLKSWAVPKGPSYDPEVKRLAVMTEDHPYDYAAFEGVIPAGNYGAGKVIIWDNGEWEFIEPGSDPVAALAAGKLAFRLYGKKMFGEWALVRIVGRPGDRGNEWLLVKQRDEFASGEVDVTAVAPRSVVSNRLVDEVGMEPVATKAGAVSPETSPSKESDPPEGRPRVAPSREASVRTRSSRAGSPQKARPTRRRRPR